MSNLVKQRTVTILFTQTSTRETVTTSAQTWGELQRELSGNIANKRIVVRETKNTLESTEAQLPAGNFVLFAYPKESKAGAKAAKKVKKAAKKVAKKAAKKAAKKSAKKVAKKKATGKVSASQGKKISKTVGAVATAKVAKEDDVDALIKEASAVKSTLPGGRY